MPTPKDRLLEAVEKSGFPLELRAAHLLQQFGYEVATNLYYVDQDEGKGREIDIRALRNYKFRGVHDDDLWVRHCLFIQCKRSSKGPWAFFTSPATGYDAALTDPLVSGLTTNAKWSEPPIPTLLQSTHPLGRLVRRGRSFTEPLKKEGTEETIFSALVTAAKATINAVNSSFCAGYGSVCFYFPVVLLDGELWDVHLKGDGSLDAEPASRVGFSFFYQSPNYQQRLLMPIVTWEDFKAFLQDLDKTLELIGAHFQRNQQVFMVRPGAA